MAEDQPQQLDKPSSKPEITNSRNSETLSRIEKKVTLVMVLVFFQSLLLAAWMLTYILPRFFVYLQILLMIGAMVVAAYYFRNQIPGWIGAASRSVFAFLGEAEKKV